MSYTIFETEQDGRVVQLLSFLSAQDIANRPLPGPAVMAFADAGQKVTSETVTVNQRFIEAVHSIIATNAPNDPAFMEQAQQVGTGLVYILDARGVAFEGGQPSEDDILGQYVIGNGVPVEKGYKPNPEFKCFTNKGPLQLTPFYRQALRQHLLGLIPDRTAD